MESNLKEVLIPRISPPAPSSPSPTAASGSDADIGKTDPTPPRLPPPPASPSLLDDMPKNGASSSHSPSPPSVSNANVAKYLSLPPQSSTPGASDSDERFGDNTEAPGGPDPSPPGPALGSNGPLNALGLQEDPTANSLATSPSTSSSPPASRGWFGFRRRQLHLPVYGPAPPPPLPQGRSFNWFHEWKETNRPKGPRVPFCFLPFATRSVFIGNSVLLDSTGVEKVIGIFGFSLFGSISLLPSTMDRISANKLPDLQKTILMMGFGLVWVAASVGVLCGLHGKTDLEQAVCRHTGRLSMLGLVLLVILHVRWALPAGDGYDAGCYVLAGLAALLHFGSWLASCIVGEDRMEDAAPADAQQ